MTSLVKTLVTGMTFCLVSLLEIIKFRHVFKIKSRSPLRGESKCLRTLSMEDTVPYVAQRIASTNCMASSAHTGHVGTDVRRPGTYADADALLAMPHMESSPPGGQLFERWRVRGQSMITERAKRYPSQLPLVRCCHCCFSISAR